MGILEKYIDKTEHNNDYHKNRVNILNTTEKANLEKLILMLESAGAKESFSWAFS